MLRLALGRPTTLRAISQLARWPRYNSTTQFIHRPLEIASETDELLAEIATFRAESVKESTEDEGFDNVEEEDVDVVTEADALAARHVFTSEKTLPSRRQENESIPPPGPDVEQVHTEHEWASAVIHGRAMYKPHRHPAAHDIPVGSIQFRAHYPDNLPLFTHFVMHAASALGIATSGVVSLPTQRSLWTVLKAPSHFKKSQENFDRKTHKRMIKLYDANPEVVQKLFEYISDHAMGGIGMRFTAWKRYPVGIGEKYMGNVQDAFDAVNSEKVKKIAAEIVEKEMRRETKKKSRKERGVVMAAKS